MDVDILYDISKNSESISKLKESNFLDSANKLISMPFEDIRALGQSDISSSLSALSAIYNGVPGDESVFKCYKPQNRINTYLNVIQTQISTLTDFVKSINSNAKIQLNSSIEEFAPTTKVFGLTDYNTKTEQTFDLLSSFVDLTLNTSSSKSTAVIVRDTSQESNTIEMSAMTIPMLESFIRSLFFGQNIGMTLRQATAGYSSFLSHFHCKKSLDESKSCICLSELKMMLNYFIQKLKNTKRVSISIQQKITNTRSQIYVYGKSVVNSTYFSTGDEATGRNIYITIGPYSTTLASTNDLNVSILEQANVDRHKTYRINEENLTVINLHGLVYDVSSGTSSEKILPKTTSCTNGIFGYELIVNKYDHFQLKLSDVLQMYTIEKGGIINRKNILYAIDYIFNYWLDHMSLIEYKVTICHDNCHTNVATAAYSMEKLEEKLYPVELTVPMRFTPCGCDITSTEMAFAPFLTEKAAPADSEYRYTSSSRIQFKVYLNSYEGNPSPKELTMNSISLVANGFTPGIQMYSFKALPDSVTIMSYASRNYKLSFAATPNDSKEKKENYFCIKITVKSFKSLVTTTVIPASAS